MYIYIELEYAQKWFRSAGMKGVKSSNETHVLMTHEMHI